MNAHAHPRPDWDAIDTVLLDLDGTLLDQAYDNHIWRDLVPQRFAAGQALDVQAARTEILRRFAATSGTLDYYSIDHWSRELGIDIGALHREARSQVAWLPGAREFLGEVRAAGKRQVLLTNSHPLALAVKHEQTQVLDYLDASVSSHDFGYPKEDARFWDAAVRRFGFDPARSLFVDDNARMLDAARAAGIRWVYGVRHWDSKSTRREHVTHASVDSVLDLLK
jgi:HAD superfamily hydrolase (TIGR01509 family)